MKNIESIHVIEKAYSEHFPAIACRLESLAKDFEGKKAYLADTHTRTKKFSEACEPIESKIKNIFDQHFSSIGSEIKVWSCLVRKYSNCSRLMLEIKFSFSVSIGCSYHTKELIFAHCGDCFTDENQILTKALDLNESIPCEVPSVQAIEANQQALKELAQRYEKEKAAIEKEIPYWARK